MFSNAHPRKTFVENIPIIFSSKLYYFLNSQEYITNKGRYSMNKIRSFFKIASKQIISVNFTVHIVNFQF